jgi:hypothetical protein
MIPSLIHAIDPLDRFTRIYHSLQSDSRWPTDQAWLFFAAQATAMRPADPGITAQDVRDMARHLHLHAPWYSPLPVMMHVVVAATLVQIGDRPEAFDRALTAARAAFREAGLPHGAEGEILAVLALRVLADGGDIAPQAVTRLRDIYRAMKRHHRWLTGSDDLPACAVLTSRPGSPQAIEGEAESLYQILRSSALPAGQHLQAAANFLPLSGLPVDLAAARFRALGEALAAAGAAVYDEWYDAIALLCLLDHEPGRVAERLLEIRATLLRLKPAVFGAIEVSVAAGLAYLDLVRFDRHRRPLSGTDELERVHRAIRLQRAASLALARVPPVPVADYPIYP